MSLSRLIGAPEKLTSLTNIFWLPALQASSSPTSLATSLAAFHIITAYMDFDLRIVIASDSEDEPVGTAAEPIPIDSDSEDEAERVGYPSKN